MLASCVHVVLIYLLITFASFVGGQTLSVTSLPEVLFEGGSKTIVEGSVIFLYCEVSTISTLIVVWNRNDVPLMQDVPHIRMRNFASSTVTTFLLVVDNFRTSDNGLYQCIVQDGVNIATGRALHLRGSVSVIGSLKFISVTTENFIFRNRTHYTSGAQDPKHITYKIGHVGDDTTTYLNPQSQWLKDGRPRSNEMNTLATNGQLTTELSMMFRLSDAGVYQCAFSDTARSEVFFPLPIRIDSGEVLVLERLSPFITVLDPPEKLVLEVRATGRYNFIQWIKNSDPAGLGDFEVVPDNFVHFSEIYIQDVTTMDDLGIYEVQLNVFPSQIPNKIAFAVILPDGADTISVANEVTLVEGQSVDISCSSMGVPIPTITWRFHDEAAPFDQNDVFTDQRVVITGGRVDNIIRGNVISNLHIVNAHYPTHDGVYQCVGSNSHAGQSYATVAMVIVNVQVIPVVNLTANKRVVAAGQDVTMTCNVTRGNPMDYTYMWINVDTVTTLPEPSHTLHLNSITLESVGTYECMVRNVAGTGRDSITIELGVIPNITAEVSPPGAVLLGSSVNLLCVAVGGNEPISFSWTDSNGVGIFPKDTDGNILVSFTVSEDYGTYTCTASNFLGTSTVNVEVTQGLLFQVRFLGIMNCADWMDSMIIEKEAQIIQTITKQSCVCNIQITDARFLCFKSTPDTITFRAKIAPSNSEYGTLLTMSLTKWIASGVSISIQSQLIEVDRDCTVLIASFDEGECLPRVPMITSNPATGSRDISTVTTSRTTDISTVNTSRTTDTGLSGFIPDTVLFIGVGSGTVMIVGIFISVVAIVTIVKSKKGHVLISFPEVFSYGGDTNIYEVNEDGHIYDVNEETPPTSDMEESGYSQEYESTLFASETVTMSNEQSSSF